MKIKRSVFNKKKDELRKKLENANEEELKEIRKEAEELENVEIEEDEITDNQIESENVDERSLLRGTIDRLEKRSANLSTNAVKEIRKNDGEDERKINEMAENLRSGKTIKMSTGIEKRSVSIKNGDILVPGKTKKEIAESYDKPSALVDKLNVVPLNGGDSYSVSFEKSVGEGGETAEGDNYTDSDPDFGYVDTKKVKITAYTEISEEIEKLPDADYLSRVQAAVIKALKKKIGKMTISGNHTTNSKQFNGIYNAENAVIDGTTDIKLGGIDADTLNEIVFALGGAEDVEAEAVLILSKKDLEAFSKVKTEDGKFVYKITREKGYGKISYQNGGSEVEYVINSACNSLSTATVKDTKTMIYGALEDFELPVFSDIEVKISDDYKFKEGMKCIKASVMVGGTVSRFNGFVRVLFYKAV